MPFAPAIRGYIDYYFIEDDKIYLYDWKSNRAHTNHGKRTNWKRMRITSIKNMGWVIGHLAFLRFDRVFSHEYTPEEMKIRAVGLEYCPGVRCSYRKVKAGEDVDIHFPKHPATVANYCGYKNLCLQKCSVPEAITTYAEAVETHRELLNSNNLLKSTR